MESAENSLKIGATADDIEGDIDAWFADAG